MSYSSSSSSVSSSSTSLSVSSSSESAGWVEYFDNTKWYVSGAPNPLGGGWNTSASRWESLDNPTFDPPYVRHYLTIEPTGSWYKGFRPSEIRVTHTFPISGEPQRLILTGQPSAGGEGVVDLINQETYISETETPINSAGIKHYGNFKYLDMYSRDLNTGTHYITKIEFKV